LMCSFQRRSRTAAESRLERLAVLVIIISRAGSLGRNHQSAYRAFGRTLLSEELTLHRLEYSLQHFAALGSFRVSHADTRHCKPLLGIPLRITVFDAECRLRNETHATPFEI